MQGRLDAVAVLPAHNYRSGPSPANRVEGSRVRMLDGVEGCDSA